MEEQHGGQHAEDIAQADHRIGGAEGKYLDDIHPQQRTQSEEEATGGKLPVDQQIAPELTCPAKDWHPHEGELQEHLTTGQQQALQQGVGYYSPHVSTMAIECTAGCSGSPRRRISERNKGVVSS